MLNKKRAWLLANLAAAKEDVNDGKEFYRQHKKFQDISISGDPEKKTITVSVAMDMGLFEAVKNWGERNCKDVFEVLGILHITV